MSPKLRQTLYYLGTLITGGLGILVLYGAIDQGAADHLGGIVTGIVALFGAAAPAVAANQVNKQRKDGTFELPADPVAKIETGVAEVVKRAEEAQSNLDRIKDIALDRVDDIPLAGPIVRDHVERLDAVKDSLLERVLRGR